jgi:hypothetical protein
MDYDVDQVLRDQCGHARLVSSFTDNKGCARRHRPIEAGREIVEDHYALAGIDKRVNHVASDIAGTPGDQDRHAIGPIKSSATGYT